MDFSFEFLGDDCFGFLRDDGPHWPLPINPIPFEETDSSNAAALARVYPRSVFSSRKEAIWVVQRAHSLTKKKTWYNTRCVGKLGIPKLGIHHVKVHSYKFKFVCDTRDCPFAMVIARLRVTYYRLPCQWWYVHSVVKHCDECQFKPVTEAINWMDASGLEYLSTASELVAHAPVQRNLTIVNNREIQNYQLPHFLFNPAHDLGSLPPPLIIPEQDIFDINGSRLYATNSFKANDRLKLKKWVEMKKDQWQWVKEQVAVHDMFKVLDIILRNFDKTDGTALCDGTFFDLGSYPNHRLGPSIRQGWLETSGVFPDRNNPFYDWMVFMVCLCTAATQDKILLKSFKKFFCQHVYKVSPHWLLEYVDTHGIDRLSHEIGDSGMGPTNARRLYKIAKDVVEKWKGHVPQNFYVLTEYEGVGGKIAQLFLHAMGHCEFGFPCDVHVLRIAAAWGWTETKPEKKDFEMCMLQICAWMPRKEWYCINNLYAGLGQSLSEGVLKDRINARNAVEEAVNMMTQPSQGWFDDLPYEVTDGPAEDFKWKVNKLLNVYGRKHPNR